MGRRVIVDAKAAVVRRIFAEYAAGRTPRHIRTHSIATAPQRRGDAPGMPPRLTAMQGGEAEYCETNFTPAY